MFLMNPFIIFLNLKNPIGDPDMAINGLGYGTCRIFTYMFIDLHHL